MVVVGSLFFIWETKKWLLVTLERWLSYTVTIVWEFAWADSALGVLYKWLFEQIWLYRFNAICDSFVFRVWYEWTIREWFTTSFSWMKYVGFSFTELPKRANLDTCSFYMLKDSRWRWNKHPKLYIRHRNKMICPLCFEGCLFLKPHAL